MLSPLDLLKLINTRDGEERLTFRLSQVGEILDMDVAEVEQKIRDHKIRAIMTSPHPIRWRVSLRSVIEYWENEE